MNTLLDEETYPEISDTQSGIVEPVIGAMRGQNMDDLQISGKRKITRNI